MKNYYLGIAFGIFIQLLNAYTEPQDRSSFALLTDKPEKILAIINANFPKIPVMSFSGQRGYELDFICAYQDGIKIRALIEEKLGKQSVADWGNLTPHTFKTTESKRLFDSEVPPFPHQDLSEQTLQSLTEEHRKELGDDMLYIVNNLWLRGHTEKQMQIHQAARTLGYLRLAEAIPTLAEHLDYRLDGLFRKPELPEELVRPAAVALARIGKPASEKMLQIISQSSQPEERQLAAWVLLHSEGADLAKVFQQLDQIEKKSLEIAVKADEAKSYLQRYIAKWNDKALILADL